MKRALTVLACAAVLFSIVAAVGEGEAALYPSPLEAIRFYHGRLAAGDFEGALDAFATDEMADGFDYAAYVSRIKAVMGTMQMPFPDGLEGAYAPLNRAVQEGFFARQTHSFLSVLLLGPGFEPGIVYPLRDGAITLKDGEALTLEAFIARFDPARLKGLALRYVARVDSELSRSDKHRENVAKMGAVYGFSAQEELLALYEFEGGFHAQGFTAARFEGGWGITGLTAPLSGLNETGAKIEGVSIREFLESGDYEILYAQE